MTAPNGDQWIALISELRDPLYYNEPWIITSHFKKLPEGAALTPEPCSAK
jgi:hypothetical protein